MEYLVNHGYELTMENFDQAKTILEKGCGTNHEYNLKTVEYVNHLNDLTEKQLEILIELARLKDNRTVQPKINYEYKIETVSDNMTIGQTLSYSDIKKIIEQYSKDGYRLAHCIVNELGRKSAGALSQLESKTIEQYILIFEKPKFSIEE